VRQATLFVTLLAWCCTAASACTTFMLQGGGRIYFGRNLDWQWEEALVLVNPRGLRKTAFVPPGHTAATWTARYRSVTFNQVGRELPYGGMNEAGLVVETMWLEESQYPSRDDRPELSILQWIQYQLDTCRTVQEVLATNGKVRLEPSTVPAKVHFLVADASGEGATLEFLGGRLVVHRGRELPCRALANSTYGASTAHYRADPGRGGGTGPLPEPTSLRRFARAARRAESFRPGTDGQDLDYAFATLEQVRSRETVWRIVYDLGRRRIHFLTRSNPRRRVLDLRALDFEPGRPVFFVDIQADPSTQGKPAFQELTESLHREHLQRFLGQESLQRRFGNVLPIVEPLLQTLRGYGPVASP
jgi:choloylglycine hydrolase